MIKKEFLRFFGAKDEGQAKKNAYKYTDCGMWINFRRGGVVLGSIVEGSENGTNEFEFKYKDLTEGILKKTINAIEDQASLIWDWANKIRNNGKTDAESGLDCPLL